MGLSEHPDWRRITNSMVGLTYIDGITWGSRIDRFLRVAQWKEALEMVPEELRAGARQYLLEQYEVRRKRIPA